MRKLRLLSLYLLVIILIGASCTKEGPEGPVGATGLQGPPGNVGPIGPAGPAGPAGSSAIYSAWFILPLTTWADSSTDWLGDISRSIKSAPSVTQTILDQGVVLAYINTATAPASNSIYPLPFNVPNPVFAGETLQVGYIMAPSKVIFYLADLIFPDMTGFGLTTPFRYVVIPGTVSGGRLASGPAKGRTVTELKKMSYEQVKRMFNIPENGTNIQ
jgi:hypothetical protein